MKIEKTFWTESTFVNRSGEPVMRTKTEVIKDEKTGQEFPVDVPTDEPMTLEDMLTIALDSWQQNKEPKPSLKYDRYKCIKKIKEGDADWTIDELKVIKDAVDEHTFKSYIYGQIIDLINDKEQYLKVVKDGEKKENA